MGIFALTVLINMSISLQNSPNANEGFKMAKRFVYNTRPIIRRCCNCGDWIRLHAYDESTERCETCTTLLLEQMFEQFSTRFVGYFAGLKEKHRIYDIFKGEKKDGI
jgi:hypothetical protein